MNNKRILTDVEILNIFVKGWNLYIPILSNMYLCSIFFL